MTDKLNKYYHFALLAASLILALAVGGCSNAGSGTIVTEARSVDDFDGIYVVGEGTVYLSQGEEVSVVVETDDNLIDKVYTDVKGKTLELSYASGPLGTHLKPSRSYIYHITVVDLENISIKGSVEVFAEDIVAEELDLEVTGSGQIEMVNLQADEVNALIKGSGQITVSGEADTQEISVTGSGTFDGHDFEGQYVNVTNKGSATVTVWATVELVASLEGEGDIHYYGDVVPNVSYGTGGEVVSLGSP